MAARVNLRLPQGVFDIYQEFADTTNVTVTELIRDMVVEGSQLFQQLNVIIQRAREGDKTAAAQVAELVIKGAYREIDVLRAMVKDDESGDQADGDSAGR
jgi:hypothetical protein